MRTILNPRNGVIVEYVCSRGENVYVYPGELSPYDIRVKYKQNASRERTPKHIHWVVDLLLKKQGNEQLTNALLDYLIGMWEGITPITNEQERANIELTCSNYPREFNALNEYGYYSIEFIILLAELLAKQEKTNRRDAYMFGRVLNKIRNSDDLFSIISASTFNGR